MDTKSPLLILAPVWDVTNDELVSRIETNLAVYVPLDWHPSENLIVTGGRDGTVRIWDALNGFELVELSVHEDAVNDVSWSPDGNMLASVGSDGKLFTWDVSDHFVERGEKKWVLSPSLRSGKGKTSTDR